MEAKLKSALGLTHIKTKGKATGGCISEGLRYETDKGLIFVKRNGEAKVIIILC